MYITLNEITLFLQTASVETSDTFIRNKFPMFHHPNTYEMYVDENSSPKSDILSEMLSYMFHDGACDELDMLNAIESFFKYKNITELTY